MYLQIVYGQAYKKWQGRFKLQTVQYSTQKKFQTNIYWDNWRLLSFQNLSSYPQIVSYFTSQY